MTLASSETRVEPTFSTLVFSFSTINGRATMLMPFGKHKGREVRSIPSGYLMWAIDHLSLDHDLANEIRRRLGMPQQLSEEEQLVRIIRPEKQGE